LINRKKQISLSKNAILSYFTGKLTLFSSDTDIGQVYTSNNLSYRLGNLSTGTSIDNTIRTGVTFKEDLSLEEALNKIFIIKHLYSIIIGRVQHFDEVFFTTTSNFYNWAVLHLCYEQPAENKYPQIKPDGIDIPISPVHEHDKFAKILNNWLHLYQERHDSINRFIDAFHKGSFYDKDRLIASANAFDLLPTNALKERTIGNRDPELREVANECKEIIKCLPDSPEKSSLMGAFGRVEHKNLKRKIRERVELIENATENEWSEIKEITDFAIDCRNHFIHGSPIKIDWQDNSDIVIFLNWTLEFVFMVSHLIEAGWDYNRWRTQDTLLSHPLSEYLKSYRSNYDKIKSLLSR